jgi:uncharacterized protein (DUF3820 family)
MSNGSYVCCNAVEHVPSCSTWPPAWLENSPQIPTSEDACGEISPWGALAAERATVDDPTETAIATAAEWDWFDHIEFVDLAYLLTPRTVSAPCPWCFHRSGHSAWCEQLHDEWSLPIPFGRHKGTPVRRVPHDYLLWLLRRLIKSEGNYDLRGEIERVLQCPSGEGVE